MDVADNLALGMQVALQWQNLAYALIGCMVGTAIGVLPGLGPLATIALLLPLTYALPPEGALIMLAGIYYGAQYGGSTTAIVINLPGEPSSIVTAIDGYQMARKGRAGVALVTAAAASFFAGCVATLLIAVFSAPLTLAALSFGPADYFSLMLLGLILAPILSSGSFVEGVAMASLGILLSTVGTDLNSGAQRYVFGISRLADGLDFVALAIGIFGIAEIVVNLERKIVVEVAALHFRNMYPTREDWRRMVRPILRGTTIGSILGVLPGGGALLASFASYAVEKKLSRHKHEFGHGAIEGVAGPESANNAGAQTSFIPLLILGLPSNAVLALMAGAMTMHNIQPGPQVMSSNPSLFWGLIASMWVGNLMLVLLNLPLVGIWVRLLTMPYHFLYPAIMAFGAIGVYSVSSSTFEIYQAAFFGAFGYLILKLELPVAPMLLGLVLGPLIEQYFRRTLLISGGDFSAFVTSPISATLLSIAIISVVALAIPTFGRTRQKLAED